MVLEPAPAATSPATRLAELHDAELAAASPAERARLLGAVGPGEAGGEAPATPQEPFTWIPDGAAATDVARRLVREHRERALERDGDVASLVLLAHADVWAGNPEQAVARCERALDRDPRHGPAWTVRGWARRALGDLAGAELDLRRGERLSDDPTWALIGLGRVAEERGDRDEARALYARALEVGGERLERPVDHATDLRERLARLGER